MKRFFSLILLSCFSLALTVQSAAANKDKEIDASTKVVDSIVNPAIDYTEVGNQLAKIEDTLKSANVSVEEISQVVRQLGEIRSQLNDTKKQIDKEFKFVQKRIEALGPVPAEGGTEPELIAQKRKEFNDEAALQKSKIAEADLLLAKIDELDTVIINVRSKKLLGNLLDRQTPLVYPTVFFHSAKLFIEFGVDIIKSPVDWFKELNAEGQDFVKANILPVSLIFLLSLWLGIYLRLFIMRHFGYNNDLDHITYSRKVSAAIFVAIAYGVIPACLIGGLLGWMISTKVMTVGFFGIVANAFLYFVLIMILCKAVARVIFAPYNERWRLVNVSTDKAKKVTQAIYFSILLIGVTSYLEVVAKKANYPLELVSFLISISSAVKAFCIALIVKRLVWDYDAEGNPTDEKYYDDDEEDGDEGLNMAFKVTFLTSVFAVAVFSLSLFGYPYLSAFIFNKFIISCLIIGVFIVIRKSFYEVLHRVLLLRFWVNTFRLRRRILRKFNFWSSLVLDPIFIILAILTLLSVWGVSTDILVQTTIKLLTGFTVGGVEISIVGIFMGILVFFIAIAVVKAMRRRLMNNVLSRMEIDDGLKHSLSSGFGFLGFIIAIMLAFMVMGGNLTSFALVAGALSVGIGLGLQNIVNNFVSGIVLLFERPFKVGDWVLVNGEEGKIKQINIRATEVETFKRASLIIPNATLLSNTVTNLTHGNNWARYNIAVGVAYGSDTQKVKEVLLECAMSHKRVLKKPEPYVLFQNFGNSSLDFELRVYVSDIWNAWMVPSDLRFEINRRFIEEGIEIPFPQMVIHRGSEVAQETEGQFYALKNKGPKNVDK